MQLLLKSEQETEDGERYQLLAFGPDNIVAAVAGNTLHFLDTKRGTVLEQIEVSTGFYHCQPPYLIHFHYTVTLCLNNLFVKYKTDGRAI